MSKKHIFLRVFSKITIFACVFCAFFISPVFASLPAGYTELEYIESTGTQYIDTGVYWYSGYSLFMDFTSISVDGNFALFGASNGAVYNDGEVSVFWFDGTFDRVVPTSNTVSINGTFGKYLADTRYTLTYDNVATVVISNNEERAQLLNSVLYSSYVGAKSIYLFSTHRRTEGDYNSIIKLHNVKIYDENRTLIRNFVPVTDNATEKIGMYDTISGTFFTNSGTGDFIAGPVANCKTFGTDGVTCTECKSGYRLDNSGGCVEIIEIATTKMVDDEFAAAEANLAATVQTIESVVSRTITQTGQIQVLQDTKQTRPDENCPANMKCLLVQDEDGTPHWYPIIEP